MAAARKPTRSTRFDQLSDEDIQARWKILFPTFVKGFAFFGSATVLVFILNHYFTLSQQMHDIAGVTFQICAIFAVCFTFLTAMALYFSGGKQARKSN